MSRSIAFLFLLCFQYPALADETTQLGVDPSKITVSGMSSGAQMAHQLHLAYSDLFSGAALLAGGPFGCAEGSVRNALGRCLGKPDTDIPVNELLTHIKQAAGDGRLASLENLENDPVWIFHGSLDTAVPEPVNAALIEIYQGLVPTGNIHSVSDIPASHTFPAKGRGSACDQIVAPFVGDCDYDAAGILLQTLYPGLAAPDANIETQLKTVILDGADEALLDETAYLFVPSACTSANAGCALHLVLHGCAQSASQVQTGFIEQSGYLPWAEANQIVLAFPQAKPSMPNALACWDWWGYSGENYLWREGKQMQLLANWIKDLANIP
jgi:dienelactone hydrolase